MRVMTEVLKPFLNLFVVVYFYDILIYNRTKEEHLKHLHQVLDVLQKEQLYLNLKKCSFMQSEVAFLGFIVSEVGLKPYPGKVRAIVAWPAPQSIKEVRSFHGLASFYRRFIRNFSSIMNPLTGVLKKGEFEWTQSAQRAFERVKALMTEAPVLTLPDFAKLLLLNVMLHMWELEQFLARMGGPWSFSVKSCLIPGNNIPLMTWNSMLW